MGDFSKLPKRRYEARVTGNIKYFTGRPCKKGHISTRLTKSGSCCECRIFGRKNVGQNRDIKQRMLPIIEHAGVRLKMQNIIGQKKLTVMPNGEQKKRIYHLNQN